MTVEKNQEVRNRICFEGGQSHAGAAVKAIKDRDRGTGRYCGESCPFSNTEFRFI